MMTSKKPALQSVLLIVSILFVSSIYAQVQPVGSVVGRQTVIQIPITSYNTMAQALIYYPDDYFKPGNENKRYPFFLFLHGMGEGSGNNITEVTNTSLPQLIAQGLNPYGIDTLTGDTLKFIIVSPHCASCGGSYQYGQLRYSVPYLINNYRIDTRCMWVGGLSMGGSATFSMMMGDSTFAKQFAGFMPMANGGWDNNMNVTQYRNNLDTTVKRGAAVLMTVGTLDGGALNNARIYSDTMRKYAQPQKFFYKEIAGGGHDGSVWNPPFYLASRIWNQRYNAWTQMANTRKVATNGPVTPPPAVVFSVAAGADQSITLPISTVTLTGSAIPATGTTITGYTWSKVSGGVAIITTPNSATTTVTGLIAGTYVFRLTATSSANTTLTDDVQITVAPGASANLPPTANAGVAQTITLPTNQVTLNGSASDPENGPINHVWTKLSGGAANITAPNNYSTTVTGLVAGNYIFRLTVTDNGSATATSDVAVTVNTATPPPPPPTGGSGYSGPNYVTSVACTEYKAAWLFRDSSVRTFTFNNTSGHVELTRYNLGARKVVAVNTGFNVITMLDDQSYVWVSKSGTMVPTRVETDTTGAVFNNNIALYGYFFTYITIRSDGSIWYWGGDDYQLYAGTNPITKPIQLSPPGLRFKKVVMGNVILGLTTTGEVYQWNKYGSLTPTKRTLPVARPAIDIFASHYSYYGCLIPDAGGDQTMGYPYIWGGDFSFWGGNAAYAEPTSIKTLWNLTVPIKEIVANQNTIHYIDALGRLWGIGDNANGEIGNGEELVNHCDQYNTPYNWSWNKGEMYSGAPPVQITPGKTYKKLFTSNTFTFYNYALDTNDSLYFWGRNKSFVGGDGAVNAQESAYPNALDVLSPKMVSPMSVLPTQTISYTFTMPTITAGANQTITGTTATLSGSATAAKLSANGRPNYGYTIASYLWTKVSGPAATITTPGSATTTVTGLVAGTYVFRLKMTDNNTGTIAANVTIVVSGSAVPNNPPTSNAGADQTITLPTNTVTINGSGTAATGSIAGYLWTKISGPNTFTIASPTQAQSVFNNLVQGTYRFELRVTDSQGFSGWDTVNVTVNPAPPNATPVANAGPNQTITLPTNTVTLTGSGTDANGSITAYVWTKIAGPSNFTIVSPAQSQTVINTLVQGVYQFELRVTDNQGAYGRDTVTVTVNPGSTPPPIPPVNQPPVANAGTNQAITLPINTVTLTSTGTDADGSVTAYTWTKIAGPANFTIVSPAQSQTVINGLVQGTYQFEMRVTDNQGAYGRDTVTVTVNPAAVPPPVNQPPVANAGTNQTITLPINTVTLSGSGTDADGNVTAYAWSKIVGPTSYTIVSPAQLQTVINGLVQGTYQFELRVTDNQGAYGRDTVTVIVNSAPAQPNVLPVANAGNDIGMTLPTNTGGLNGGNSYDPDGVIVSYHWNKILGPSQYSISSPNQSATNITNLTSGSYRFELVVTDNAGGIDRDTVNVVVHAAVVVTPNNIPPVADAGNDKYIKLPTSSIQLNGYESRDPDGVIVKYRWSYIDGPAGSVITTPDQMQSVINTLLKGVYHFALTVEDNNGATSIDTIRVEVISGNTEVRVYPNPAIDYIDLYINASTDKAKMPIVIYDLKGVVVYREEFTRTQATVVHRINVASLKKGVYFVKIGVSFYDMRTVKFLKE